VSGRRITVELDGNGNVNIALIAGPNCAVGLTMISANTIVGKGNTRVESFSAPYEVLEAKPTPPGVFVMPKEQVEDEASSSVATLIQAEYGSTEALVRVAAPELFARCEVAPHLEWFRPVAGGKGGGELVKGGKELQGEAPTVSEPKGKEALKTDNDGNAFVIVIGTASCKPGISYFVVDLELSPFTTEEPSFTIKPSEPTPPF
jgi:hypothetical protein